MDPKTFWTQFFYPIFLFYPNFFEPQIFLDLRFLDPKSLQSQKKCGSKIVLDPKLFWTQNVFFDQNYFVPNFFWTKLVYINPNCFVMQHITKWTGEWSLTLALAQLVILLLQFYSFTKMEQFLVAGVVEGKNSHHHRSHKVLRKHRYPLSVH